MRAWWRSGSPKDQPFVVENRPGAGGMVSAEAAAGAPPDGYTLLFTVAANAIDSTLYEKSGFNLARRAGRDLEKINQRDR